MILITRTDSDNICRTEADLADAVEFLKICGKSDDAICVTLNLAPVDFSAITTTGTLPKRQKTMFTFDDSSCWGVFE